MAHDHWQWETSAAVKWSTECPVRLSEAFCFPPVNTKYQAVVRLKVSRKEVGLGVQLRTPCGQVVLKEEWYPAISIVPLVNFPGGNWTCVPNGTVLNKIHCPSGKLSCGNWTRFPIGTSFHSFIVWFWSFAEGQKAYGRTAGWILAPLNASLPTVSGRPRWCVPDQGGKVVRRWWRRWLLLLRPWPQRCRKLKCLSKPEHCVVKNIVERALAVVKGDSCRQVFNADHALNTYTPLDCSTCGDRPPSVLTQKTDVERQVGWRGMCLLCAVLMWMWRQSGTRI